MEDRNEKVTDAQKNGFKNTPHVSADSNTSQKLRAHDASTSANSPHKNVNVADWERFASVAVGGGILLSTLLRPRVWKFVGLLPLAGGFLMRGATGHCSVYERLGINSAPLDVKNVMESRSQTAGPDSPPASVH